MKITKEWLIEKRAVSELKVWFEHQGETDCELVIRKLMDAGCYGKACWLIIRLLTPQQYIAHAIFASEQVLDIFEKEYPDDKQPRVAIEAAREILRIESDPSAEPADKLAARVAAKVAAKSSGDMGDTIGSAWDIAGAAAWSAWSAAWTARSASNVLLSLRDFVQFNIEFDSEADAESACWAAGESAARSSGSSKDDSTAVSERKRMLVSILEFGLAMLDKEEKVW